MPLRNARTSLFLNTALKTARTFKIIKPYSSSAASGVMFTRPDSSRTVTMSGPMGSVSRSWLTRSLQIDHGEKDFLAATACRKREPGRHCGLADATLANNEEEPPVEHIHLRRL